MIRLAGSWGYPLPNPSLLKLTGSSLSLWLLLPFFSWIRESGSLLHFIDSEFYSPPKTLSSSSLSDQDPIILNLISQDQGETNFKSLAKFNLGTSTIALSWSPTSFSPTFNQEANEWQFKIEMVVATKNGAIRILSSSSDGDHQELQLSFSQSRVNDLAWSEAEGSGNLIAVACGKYRFEKKKDEGESTKRKSFLEMSLTSTRLLLLFLLSSFAIYREWNITDIRPRFTRWEPSSKQYCLILCKSPNFNIFSSFTRLFVISFRFEGNLKTHQLRRFQRSQLHTNSNHIQGSKVFIQ